MSCFFAGAPTPGQCVCVCHLVFLLEQTIKNIKNSNEEKYKGRNKKRRILSARCAVVFSKQKIVRYTAHKSMKEVTKNVDFLARDALSFSKQNKNARYAAHKSMKCTTHGVLDTY
eukprot:GEMP01085945.1.p1 GENE.GEMP01085945.1~~GEMP01085945.1.p1  ORF type:complete len:115 (+),score=8.49 GEMP01085945.1:589-933(+)